MPITVKFPFKYKVLLFGVLALSWISGITFFILLRMVRVEGEFGPEQHPFQYPVLQIHGAAAFLMIISYGYLLASHVRVSWKTKKNRIFGISLVACHGWMIISGYVLYYLSGEGLAYKNLVSYAHFSIGFMYPFLLFCHMRKGQRGVGESFAALSLLCSAAAFLYAPFVLASVGFVLGMVGTIRPTFRFNGLAAGGITLAVIVFCFSGKTLYEKRIGAFVWDPWSYEMEKIPSGDEWDADSFEDSWDSDPIDLDGGFPLTEEGNGSAPDAFIPTE